MKKILIAVAIIVLTFMAGAIISGKATAGYLFNNHAIGGGLYGSVGTPFKVDSSGAVYIR